MCFNKCTVEMTVIQATNMQVSEYETDCSNRIYCRADEQSFLYIIHACLFYRLCQFNVYSSSKCINATFGILLFLK